MGGKRGRQRRMLAGVLIFLALAGCAFVFLRFRNGVRIRAGQDFVTGADIVCYRQDDVRWGDDRLGESRFTLRSSGCLVSCIASALSMGRGEEETPETLNGKFSSEGVYDEEGNIQWGKLRELGDYQVDVYQEISAELVDACLAEGKYPIVRVRVNGIGNFHFVLVAGAENGEYLCMDPLQDGIMQLRDYGSRIYGIRCVY